MSYYKDLTNRILMVMAVVIIIFIFVFRAMVSQGNDSEAIIGAYRMTRFLIWPVVLLIVILKTT